jgi:hypothetical protein
VRDKILKAISTHPPMKGSGVVRAVCEQPDKVHRVLRTLLTDKAIRITGNGFYFLNKNPPPPKRKPVAKRKVGRPTKERINYESNWPHTPKPLPEAAPKQQPKKYPTVKDDQVEQLRKKRETSPRLIDTITRTVIPTQTKEEIPMGSIADQGYQHSQGQEKAPMSETPPSRTVEIKESSIRTQLEELEAEMTKPTIHFLPLPNAEFKLETAVRVFKATTTEGLQVEMLEFMNWVEDTLNKISDAQK